MSEFDSLLEITPVHMRVPRAECDMINYLPFTDGKFDLVHPDYPYTSSAETASNYAVSRELIRIYVNWLSRHELLG